MRNLLVNAPEHFFPDKLCHNLPCRLVGYCILIIKCRSVRQVFHNLLNQDFRVVTFERGHRNDLRKIKLLPVSIDISKKLFLFHCVYLIDY